MKLSTDGAAGGNPGIAGADGLIRDDGGGGREVSCIARGRRPW